MSDYDIECGFCKYYFTDKANGETGFCTRYPPRNQLKCLTLDEQSSTYFADYETKFTEVRHTQFCGEFKNDKNSVFQRIKN